jgi:hypothetical protein
MFEHDFPKVHEGCGQITATQRLVRVGFGYAAKVPRLSCNGLMRTSLTEMCLLVQVRPFSDSSEFSPDSTIGSDPWAEAYRRKFSLSQNSKSLHAGSNPSEKILIIRWIVTASIDLALEQHGEPANRGRKIAETTNKLKADAECAGRIKCLQPWPM